MAVDCILINKVQSLYFVLESQENTSLQMCNNFVTPLIPMRQTRKTLLKLQLSIPCDCRRCEVVRLTWRSHKTLCRCIITYFCYVVLITYCSYVRSLKEAFLYRRDWKSKYCFYKNASRLQQTHNKQLVRFSIEDEFDVYPLK